MIRQRFLLKFMSSRLLGSTGRKLARRRNWIIEHGEAAGLKLRFPQNLDFISGKSELPVQRALAAHIRPGHVVYDIGANIGFFSLIAARLGGPAGDVYSFEPVSENAMAVQRNARLNVLDRVHVFEIALGSYTGSAELILTEWDGGSTLSTSAVEPSDAISRRTVGVAALDELARTEKLRSPDFIKIDVEGAELEVLRGMSGILARARPILLYELDDGDKASFDRRWKELDDYVKRSFGYEIQRLENSYANEHWFVGHSLALPLDTRRTN